eukprot:1456787-Prymnesium_polylepis.1
MDVSLAARAASVRRPPSAPRPGTLTTGVTTGGASKSSASKWLPRAATIPTKFPAGATPPPSPPAAAADMAGSAPKSDASKWLPRTVNLKPKAASSPPPPPPSEAS